MANVSPHLIRSYSPPPYSPPTSQNEVLKLIDKNQNANSLFDSGSSLPPVQLNKVEPPKLQLKFNGTSTLFSKFIGRSDLILPTVKQNISSPDRISFKPSDFEFEGNIESVESFLVEKAPSLVNNETNAIKNNYDPSINLNNNNSKNFIITNNSSFTLTSNFKPSVVRSVCN